MYGVLLQAECTAGALSMLNFHSPDYVFMVVVGIFMSKAQSFVSSILAL